MSPILGIWASGRQASALTSFESIATTTVGAGGSATVTFSSIPSTYTHLQLRVLYQSSANGVIRFNSDSTFTNYRSHYLEGNGSTIGSGTVQNASYTGILTITGIANSTSIFGGAIIDVLDYVNTNKNKTVRSLNGIDKNGTGVLALDSGLWMNTAAISSITLESLGSTFSQYSSFALYGIK